MLISYNISDSGIINTPCPFRDVRRSGYLMVGSSYCVNVCKYNTKHIRASRTVYCSHDYRPLTIEGEEYGKA